MGCELEHRGIIAMQRPPTTTGFGTETTVYSYSEPFNSHNPLDKHNEVHITQKNKLSLYT